jgi:hypothetical protein
VSRVSLAAGQPQPAPPPAWPLCLCEQMKTTDSQLPLSTTTTTTHCTLRSALCTLHSVVFRRCPAVLALYQPRAASPALLAAAARRDPHYPANTIPLHTTTHYPTQSPLPTA